ncbi:MAG: hypothetical protein QOE44_483 [Solirubrobacteraceae bacterium]|nr:hypothetical protein [Solirubrobacteraceae bacterium]
MALGLYAIAAVVLIARPAVGDPSHVCVCVGPAGDPPFFMWALKWWPYAVGHGLNPFYSHAVWYPGGANIATATSIPGAAGVLWPVTSLWGPVVAYNVGAVLGPVLSAQAAYGLCRYVTDRYWPSVVGGFVYGFSSYELAQLMGHLHIALVFLVPLVPLVVLRRLDGRISRAGFVVGLGAIMAGQALLSTEIAFDVLLLGALGLLPAWWLTPAPGRRRLGGVLGEIAVAGALAAAVISPYLYWALIKGNPGRHYGTVAGTVFAERYRLNPLNLVVPTPITWLGGASVSGLHHFDGGNIVEAGGYVGLPLLLVFAAGAVATRRRAGTRFLVVMLGIALVLALGPRLSYGAHSVIPLPWRAVENAPLFKAVLPTRFALFVALILGVGVAVALARERRRPWVAWAAAIAGVLAVLPDPTGGFWHSRVAGVPLVVADAGRYLPARGSILMVPVGQFGYSMYWQAASDFAFVQANGRVGLVLPPEYAKETASLVMANYAGPPGRADLHGFLIRHRVTAVVVQPQSRGLWEGRLLALGLHRREVAGVSIYYACGQALHGQACDARTATPLKAIRRLPPS